MTLDEARNAVREGSQDWPQLVEAAGLIFATPESSYSDLLECLRHRGLPSEFAAMQLYRRTKRPTGSLGLVLDHDDWTDYLRQHAMI